MPCLHVCVYHVHAQCLRSEEGLELELWVVVSHRIGTELNPNPWQEQQALVTTEPAPASLL